MHAQGHSRQRSMLRRVIAVSSIAVALAAAGVAERVGSARVHVLPSARSSQSRSTAARPTAPLERLHVQGAVHVIVGAGANVVVQVGPIGAVVVDAGLEEHGPRVVDAIRAISTTPIRFIVNTHAHPDHVGANERLAASGAGIGNRAVATVGSGQLGRPEIVAHELVLNRMSTAGTAVPVGTWPTATFSSDEKVLFVNGEGVQIIHQPAAHTDGDTLVFFRRSDVIAAGDLYSTETYPIIDVAQGGSIAGVLAGLNRLLALAISGEKVEGGTMIVPGHGRISDEADLAEYRDMVTIVRDRVQDLAGKGMTIAQVQAARPTLEYDGLYGHTSAWTPAQFVEAIYRTLPRR
jgi:glyoxylase-like metal-dependent hydrolase (beta-lactamase superfamily II)